MPEPSGAGANDSAAPNAEERGTITKIQLHMTMLNPFLDGHFCLERERESIVRRE
ncbi:MAG: hypothetical protein ACJ8EY_00180 [Sphingomicrobium sp.]